MPLLDKDGASTIGIMQLEDRLLTVLGLVVVIGYGYSMDMPQALQAPLREEPCNLDSLQINLLYFCTYLPVMITDIPFGIILDKFPLQKTVLVIAFSSFFSELLIAVLFDFRPEGYIYMVYVLRAVVGMAGSSAFTMQGFIMARYASQNFEMMMGFGMSLPFIFSAINVAIVPYIYDSTHSISLPWYIASIFDLLAVLAAIGVSILVGRKERRKRDESLLRSQQGQEQEQQEQFKASYLLQLPRLFWIIIGTTFTYQVALCIYENLNELILNRFCIDYVTIGYMLVIPYTLGAVLALIFGHILKVKPRLRRKIILFAAVFLSAGLMGLYFLGNNGSAAEVSALDFIVIVAFMISLSMVAGSTYTVLTSSVSLLADKKRLGTAWGVIGMVIGLGESISSIINGLVEDGSNLGQSYTTLTLIYLLISCGAIAMALWIFIGPYHQIDINFNQSRLRDEVGKDGTLDEVGNKEKANKEI